MDHSIIRSKVVLTMQQEVKFLKDTVYMYCVFPIKMSKNNSKAFVV